MRTHVVAGRACLAVSLVLTVTVASTAQPPQEGAAPPDPALMDMAARKLACGPAVVFERPERPMRIVASADGSKRRLYGTGDKVVVDAGSGRGLSPGQFHYVRRIAQRFDDRYRKRGEPINLETAGWVRIEGVDETTAVATILHACDGVLLDDYIEPFKPPRVAAAMEPATGEVDYSSPGRIVQIRDGRRSVGDGDLFIMDRGADHGLAAGTRVLLFRSVLPNRGPVVQLAEGTVLTVDSETSVVRVDRSRDAAYVGDFVAIRR